MAGIRLRWGLALCTWRIVEKGLARWARPYEVEGPQEVRRQRERVGFDKGVERSNVAGKRDRRRSRQIPHDEAASAAGAGKRSRASRYWHLACPACG